MSSRQKVMRNVEAHKTDDKLFHTCGSATENAQLLEVDRQMGRTIRVDVANECTWLYFMWTYDKNIYNHYNYN